MISPMIVPTILVGVASFFTLSSLGIKGDISGYVLIYTMLSLPIVVIVISSRLQSFDVALEEAAHNLGANRWAALWHVTLPIISPAVFVAAVFAFNVAFEEAIIVMFIAKPGITTLPNQMYNTLIEDASLVVAAVSSLQIVATVSIFGAAALVGKHRS
jgi:ABC-type spermidine/putrescine transport system permease subunit II